MKMKKWTRVMYQPNLPLKEGKYVTASKEHISLSKEAAGEGMVLLKNESSLLPLGEGNRVALFGKGSFDYVKGGGGSGDVSCAYVICMRGLSFWGRSAFTNLCQTFTGRM